MPRLLPVPPVVPSATPQWTHLLGALAALLSLYLTFASTRPDSWWHDAHRQGWKAPFSLVWPFPSSFQPSVTAWDAAGFAVFFASAATCLGLSAAFHTMVCHSPRVAFLYNRLDYLGIVVLISGTFVPAVRYGFFCDPHLRNFYIALIYTFSALVTAVTMSDRARTPEFRRLRTWLFIALGLSAVFPVGHAVQRYGLQGASDAIALPWLALGGLLYIVGALFYAERFPERLFVGRCDRWGGSHTIFHVFILAAALAHYGAIVDGFRYWHVERKGQCGVASW
jgi:adiponectin receptor